MKKKLDILSIVVFFILVNWFCYHEINTPLAPIDFVFIFCVVLFTLLFSSIIIVKKISIADYWAFANKHVFLYRFVCLYSMNIMLIKAKPLYNSIGNMIYVVFNAVLLFYVLNCEKRKKQKKRRQKDNKDTPYCNYREDSKDLNENI